MHIQLWLNQNIFDIFFSFLFRIKDRFTVIHPSDVVLIEGILVFYDKDMMEMFDMKLFVDTDADTRLARRGKLKLLYYK